jgi:hypothetical protein
MENQICSSCARSVAKAFCVCLETLPLLCEACVSTHESNTKSDFHFILPIEGKNFVNAANQRQTKERLVILDRTHKVLIGNIDQVDCCRDEVNVKLGDHPKSAKIQKALSKLKPTLRTEIEASISATRSMAYMADHRFENALADWVWNNKHPEEIKFTFKVNVAPFSVSFDTNIPALKKFNYRKSDHYEEIQMLQTAMNQMSQQNQAISQQIQAISQQIATLPTTQQMNQAISQQIQALPTTQQMNQAISQQIQALRRIAPMQGQLSPLLTQVQPWNASVRGCWGRASENGVNNGLNDISERLSALQRVCDNHRQLLQTIIPLI